MANPATLPKRTIEQRIHAEGIRACVRTMEAIAGFSYVAGVFYSDSRAAALARQNEAERLMRAASWDIRRAAFQMLEGDDESAAADALERQREAQQADEPDDDEPAAPGVGADDTAWSRINADEHTPHVEGPCAWCDKENGVTRPSGTSHSICEKHEAALLGGSAA